jgi:hypothetical protein
VGLLFLLGLTSCQRTPLPDTSTDNQPANSGDLQGSDEEKKEAEDLTVTIADPPDRVCMGQPRDVTVTQSGFSGSKGEVTWLINFGRVWPAQKTTLQQSYTFEGLKVPTGKVRTEPIRARVEIHEISEGDIGLVDLTPKIGTFEKETDFIYCDYNLNLDYGGSFNMEEFEVNETGNMMIPVAIDPSNGRITGIGTIFFTRTQELSLKGMVCNASWISVINVEVSGSLNSSGGESDLTLDWTFENTVIEDSVLTCSGGKVNVPAPGGPIDFSAWGLDNLKFSQDGGEIVKDVSQPLGPGGSGTGKVTVILEPWTGD